MQDLPENHFAVSGASWVNIMIYLFNNYVEKNYRNIAVQLKMCDKLLQQNKALNYWKTSFFWYNEYAYSSYPVIKKGDPPPWVP